MTDTDVTVGSVLGGCAVAGNSIVDVRRYLVAVAYALAVLYDGAVRVGSAGDELGELQVNLSCLVHDDFGVALEALVIEVGNLLGEVLTDVLVKSELLNVNLCEGRLQLVVLAVCIDMESAEHCPALLELEHQEADDVECGLSVSATADGDRGANALRRGGDVGEVQSLLCNLRDLTLDGELHVVDRVRDNLCAGYTSHHHEVFGQLSAGNLGVDDGANLHGDQTTCLKVGIHVLVSAGGDGVGQDGGGVGCTTVGVAVADHLTNLGTVVLALTNLLQLLAGGHSLGTG